MAGRLSTVPTAIHYRLKPTKQPRYVVGGALLLVLLLWLGSLWHWRNSAAVGWWALGFAAVYGWTAAAIWRWQQQLPVGWLVWTGVHWRLQATAQQPHESPAYRHCVCVLDTQTTLLLRLADCTHKSPVAQTRWVWVQAACAPQQWHVLRAVVFAPKTSMR